MPTGAKVFLILSAGLLPLALIAFFASIQTTRLADQEVTNVQLHHFGDGGDGADIVVGQAMTSMDL